MAPHLEGFALAYADFATQYLRAAKFIPSDDSHLFFPRLQLWGQSIELALKAYLWSRGKDPGHGHDLSHFTAEAQTLGLQLTTDELSSIIQKVNEAYFERPSGERFMSRYPRLHGSAWVTPGFPAVAALVESILQQAAR